MRIDHINSFLEKIKDEPRNLEKCIELLYTLQHSKGTPLLETITVIKYEKPLLYSLIKPRVQSRQGLKLLFDLSMDYEESKNKLGR